MKPRVLVLYASGTNRDGEAAFACELAGGQPEIVHVNQLRNGERRLLDYHMLVLPGGFSYGDDLGAGKLWAVALRHRLGDDLEAFIQAGRPVLGICNGFQVLVKAGLLPGGHSGVSQSPKLPSAVALGQVTAHRQGASGQENTRLSRLQERPRASGQAQKTASQPVTLTRNDSGRFECRWVYLQPQSGSACVFTRGLREPVYCPVAHGEGKLVARDEEALMVLEDSGLVALRYAQPPRASWSSGEPVPYPWNPNGSRRDIAGICNAQGTILGMMPHPEDHVLAIQHPRYHGGEGVSGHGCGLPLFVNGIRYASEL